MTDGGLAPGGADPPNARACPWCGRLDTARIGDAGSLLMTEQWFCEGCSSAFEVIRKRGSDTAEPTTPRGPVVSTGRDGADED